jgi:hypothetical protein
MKGLIFIICLVLLPLSSFSQKKTSFKKTQEVNFDEANIDGEVRTPDGSYLHQKRGLKFLPLYKVRKSFDNSIKDSVEFLR